jgi:glycosyltransferase involved in cell wall biosynthesis
MEATRQVQLHDVLSLHLPQLDAAGIALRGKLFKKATVLTYHCDLRLPSGIINRAANLAANFTNHLAARFADAIVAYTQDFAINSPLLSKYLEKIQVITPPVLVTPSQAQSEVEFRRKFIGENGPVIGIAARLATEKGVEYLLEALPTVLERYPKAHVLFAGQYQNVMGEADYARRLQPMLERVKDHWTFLGVLNAEQMTTFYRNCDVTVLPSINSTESFGLVQIESMICSTPVVASNLPGVRQPVRMTGMGKVVPLHHGPAIAAAIIEILDHPESYSGDTNEISKQFSPARTAEGYESLFNEIREKSGQS